MSLKLQDNMGNSRLRVCYFGTYRAGYARNQILIAGLRQNGAEVFECHEALWQGIEDRVQAASGGWLRPAFAVRVARVYWNLLSAYRQVPDYDVMVLGYPGQLDVYLARLLTWLQRKPLVLDLFMSIYLIAMERGLTERHPISGRLIYWIEKVACLLPDLLVKDTVEYIAWLRNTYGLAPERFRLVPTGADDRLFCPASQDRGNDGHFRVLYYGTFIPNHGLSYIVEAARLLHDHPDIQFELVGDGPTKAETRALVEAYGLTNVAFVDWIEKKALPLKVAQADLCLGAFGTTPQSLMTVHNKIYEGLALRKCMVTGNSPAMASTMSHGQEVWLCDRGDPRSLAEAILTLQGDPGLREKLAENGHQLFLQQFSVAALGRQFKAHLQDLVAGLPPAPGQ